MDVKAIEGLASYPTAILFSVAFVYIVLRYALALPKMMASSIKAIENNTAAINNNSDAMKEIRRSQDESVEVLKILNDRMQRQEEKTEDLVSELSEVKNEMVTRSEFQTAQAQTISMLSRGRV